MFNLGRNGEVSSGREWSYNRSANGKAPGNREPFDHFGVWCGPGDENVVKDGLTQF